MISVEGESANSRLIDAESEEEYSCDFVFLEDKIVLVKRKGKEQKQTEETLDEIVEEAEDYHSAELEQHVSYNFAEGQGVDYEKLFSYLGNSAKLNDFSHNSYFSYDAPTATVEEDFFNPKFGDELIAEVIRAAKTKNTYGIEVYVNPMKKSLFDVWKLGNSTENRLRYDLMTV